MAATPFYFCGGESMNPMKNKKMYKSVLTNGDITIDIECSRFSCGINLPAGVAYTVLDGIEYLDGKQAWIEIREDED